MCGIVGILAKNNNGLFKHHVDVIKQMLFIDQLRGVDGVGVFYLVDGKTKTLKKPTHASPLLVSKEFEGAMTEAVKESPFIIGHNRASTRGENTWKNTHPFTEDHITLVHNGTLSEYKSLNNTVDVDSHAICKHMAQETDKDTIEKIHGAFALVWYNKEDGTLNLCRNAERPLYLIECNFCYLICSEVGLGKWIGERNNLIIVKEICLLPGIKYTFYMKDLGGYTETEMALRKTPTYPVVVGHINQMKQTGATIEFSPCMIGKKGNAILFDLVTNKHYMLGKVDKEPSVYIRVYGDPVYLKTIKDTPKLSGTIASSTRSYKAITYSVICIKEIVGITQPEDLFTEEECMFCSSSIRKDELPYCTPRQGGKLCPDCVKQFKAFDWE